MAEAWERLWAEMDWDDAPQRERRVQERLRQRAIQYAKPQSPPPLSEDALWRVLSFRLGVERYGIEVGYVRGVRPLGRMARLPNAPVFYAGVIAHRGRMVTVLDLRAFFGASNQGEAPQEAILIEGHGLSLACLAHHIEDVQTIVRAEVRDVGIAYTYGVSHEQIVVLNAESLLTDDRLMLGGKEE